MSSLLYVSVHSYTVVRRCPCTVSTTSHCFNWCHTWHIYLLSSRLCVQHLHHLLNRVELVQLHCPALFCVSKHLSALTEKMLVFLQSLPWVMGGKYGGWNIFFFLSQHPSHTYSLPLFFIYLLYIYFLSFITSIQCQVLIWINRWWTILTSI